MKNFFIFLISVFSCFSQLIFVNIPISTMTRHRPKCESIVTEMQLLGRFNAETSHARCCSTSGKNGFNTSLKQFSSLFRLVSPPKSHFIFRMSRQCVDLSYFPHCPHERWKISHCQVADSSLNLDLRAVENDSNCRRIFLAIVRSV